MVGMNSDRMAISAAQRAKAGNGLGTVIVALQQTQYDSSASLRIYAPIDRVMEMLAAEMRFDIPQAQANLPTQVSELHVFPNLPYTKDGLLSSTSTVTLDLRPGARVRIVGQQGWDKERWGEVGNPYILHQSCRLEKRSGLEPHNKQTTTLNHR
eukprot:1574116-Amphidinium_carterae.1